eukprot:TCONS_00017545-protein
MENCSEICYNKFLTSDQSINAALVDRNNGNCLCSKNILVVGSDEASSYSVCIFKKPKETGSYIIDPPEVGDAYGGVGWSKMLIGTMDSWDACYRFCLAASLSTNPSYNGASYHNGKLRCWCESNALLIDERPGKELYNTTIFKYAPSYYDPPTVLVGVSYGMSGNDEDEITASYGNNVWTYKDCLDYCLWNAVLKRQIYNAVTWGASNKRCWCANSAYITHYSSEYRTAFFREPHHVDSITGDHVRSEPYKDCLNWLYYVEVNVPSDPNVGEQKNSVYSGYICYVLCRHYQPFQASNYIGAMYKDSMECWCLKRNDLTTTASNTTKICYW